MRVLFRYVGHDPAAFDKMHLLNVPELDRIHNEFAVGPPDWLTQVLPQWESGGWISRRRDVTRARGLGDKVRIKLR